MKNKLVFLLAVLFLLLFSNTGHSQWLVDGGNIFYPYGNVSVTNGDFTLSDDFSVSGKSRFLDDIYISDGSMSALNFMNNDDAPFVNLIPARMGIKLGDVNYWNAGTSLLVDDYYQLIKLYSTDSILVDCFGTLLLGDASNLQYGTKISILDNDKKINLSADSVNITGVLNVGGIKEYIALITWHASSPPTVAVIKNTLGASITWSNVDDLGKTLAAYASSGVFTYSKTSNFSTIYNDSDVNRFLIGNRVNDTAYSITSWNASGDIALQIDDFQFLFKISVFP